MKRLLILIPVAVLTLTGCAIIPNDMGYPTFHAFNSPEAKAYRAQKKQERDYKKVGEEQAKEWGPESMPKK